VARRDVNASSYLATLAWSPRPQVRTLSLPEQIAHGVGNAIIDGQYDAGTRILEQDLATQFQVSRGPVREALRILERDGLVQLTARRGAQVVQFDRDELKQIFHVRAALLGLAARLATERQDRDFITELRNGVNTAGLLARTEDDADAYVATVTRMNLALAAASGNKYLRSIMFSLAHQTIRYTRLGLASKERRLESSKNWRRLLTAIENGDGNAAAKLAEILVLDSQDAALRLLDREAAQRSNKRRGRKKLRR